MKSFFGLGLLLAIGLSLGGYFIGRGIADRNSGSRIISVKGLAERHVPATLAIWSIGYQSSGNDLVELNQKLKADMQAVIEFLTKKHGFAESDIAVQPPSFSDTSLIERDKDTPPPALRYNGFQSVLLRTSKVDAIKGTLADMSELIQKQVMLTSRNSPQFSFDELNEIKPGMIQEATKNARIAAEQFSKDSQTELGKLRNASQGWFQVDDRDDATPEQKVVRVVVEVQYEVE
ncbi:MAG: SIMPL domain-containing protein [Verrucomicrobiota bacterium]